MRVLAALIVVNGQSHTCYISPRHSRAPFFLRQLDIGLCKASITAPTEPVPLLGLVSLFISSFHQQHSNASCQKSGRKEGNLSQSRAVVSGRCVNLLAATLSRRAFLLHEENRHLLITFDHDTATEANYLRDNLREASVCFGSLLLPTHLSSSGLHLLTRATVTKSKPFLPASQGPPLSIR